MNSVVAAVFETMAYPESSSGQNTFCDWAANVQSDISHVLIKNKDDLQFARNSIKSKVWTDSVSRASLLFKLSKEIEKKKDLFACVEAGSILKPLTRCKERDIPELVRHLSHAAHAVAFCPEGWTPHGLVCVVAEETNSPSLSQSFQIGPALAAGNGVVLSVSENNCYSAYLLALTAREVGFPNYVLNVVVGDTSEYLFDLNLGSAIVPPVIKPLLTERWTHVARPKAIITDSADLASAAEGVIQLSHFNAPTSPVSGACVIVQENIFSSFWSELSSRFKKLLPLPSVWADNGDFNFPLKECFEARKKMVEVEVAKGVEVVAPGTCVSYFGPLLIHGTQPTSPLVQNSKSGSCSQIVWVQSFRHYKEAVALTNSAPFSDYVSIWGEQTTVLLEIAKEVHAHNIWINSQNIVDTANGLDSTSFFSSTKLTQSSSNSEPKEDTDINGTFKKELTSAVSSAKAAFKKWTDLGTNSRSQHIFSLAQSILSHSGPCPDVAIGHLFRYASEASIPGLKPTMNADGTSAKCWTWLSARGVVAVLLPKQGLFSALLNSLGAALAAGNTFVAMLSDKPSADFMKEVFSKSSLPFGVVNVLYCGHQFQVIARTLTEAGADTAWILSENKVNKRDMIGRSFPFSHLNLSDHDWHAGQEALRDWFQRQAVSVKKVWFDTTT